MKRKENTGFRRVEAGEGGKKREGQSTLLREKGKKEMPQLEQHNVLKRAGPPTEAATGQINFTASPLSSIKLLQKNVKNTHCVYAFSICPSNLTKITQ